MTRETFQSKEKLSNSKLVMTSLVAGAFAGALAKTTIAPLDRTKINFQIVSKKYSSREAINFIKRCYEKEGFFSLWRGNSATMARIIPYAAVQFTSHEQWKRLLSVDSGDPPENEKKRRFLAGSLAGVTSQSLTYPLDLARARMAVTCKSTYNSVLQVFSKMWREEGALGFYKGYLPTILGVIPYAGVSFYTYGTLQKWIREEYGKPNTLINLACGAVSGMLGQTSSYPLDIVRRRMQTSIITGGPYTSIVGTLLFILRKEGLHGIFKGLSMNWVKGPIAVGISFATYDHIRDTLRAFLES